MLVPMILTLALLVALPTPDAGPSLPTMEVWAGHQVLKGKRKLPLWGEKQTQTENFFLAEVVRQGPYLRFKQQLCRTELQPIGKVVVRMNPTTVTHLPCSQFTVNLLDDGKVTCPTWNHGWENDDVDGDGFPGATAEISGTTCSGKIYISNQTTTTLTAARLTKDGMEGFLTVTQKQKKLGADGICLRLMSGDSTEIQSGTFAYRRLPLGTTCQSLQGKPWPIKAMPVKEEGTNRSQLIPSKP